MRAAGGKIAVTVGRFEEFRVIAVERGAVRLTHNGVQSRLDKPSRTVHVGDTLVFAVGGRLMELTVEAPGERRGPAEEARALYSLRQPLG
jgi:ribosome-associated heat shock protein Hsp15